MSIDIMKCVFLFSLLVFSFNTMSSAGEKNTTDITVSVLEEHSKHIALSTTYSLSWKLLQLAAKEVGIALIPIESTWQGSLIGVQSHNIDLVFGALKLKHREQWAHFSVPLVADGSAVFTLSENAINTLSEADKDRSIVGVFTNSSIEKMRLRDRLGFTNIYTVQSRPQLYSMLTSGRLEYAYFGQAFAEYYCVYQSERRKSNCLKQISSLYEKNNRFVLTDKNNTRALLSLESMNQKLQAMSNSPEVKRLFDEYDESGNTHLQWRQSVLAH